MLPCFFGSFFFFMCPICCKACNPFICMLWDCLSVFVLDPCPWTWQWAREEIFSSSIYFSFYSPQLADVSGFHQGLCGIFCGSGFLLVRVILLVAFGQPGRLSVLYPDTAKWSSAWNQNRHFTCHLWVMAFLGWDPIQGTDAIPPPPPTPDENRYLFFFQSKIILSEDLQASCAGEPYVWGRLGELSTSRGTFRSLLSLECLQLMAFQP